MIRILQIIGSLERAGAESFVMNLYRNLDRERVQFDFILYNQPSKDSYYEEVLALGARVFFVSPKSEGIVKNFIEIKTIVKENNYKVIWRQASNCWSGLDILAATAGGAKIRILHSHSSNSFGLERYLHFVCRPLVNLFATYRFACGQQAGRWMFNKKSFEIIPNGIDFSCFSRSEIIRKELRQKYDLDNKVVLGHVGRFHKVKNHEFLIDVFETYLNIHGNAMLVLVGNGELENNIKKYVEEKGLSQNVIFLGSRVDVYNLLQMFDIFIMPSIYEGFPVTLVEAQAMQLPCIVSDTISKEIKISNAVSFLSLYAPMIEWSKEINKLLNCKIDLRMLENQKEQYNIKVIAKRVEEMVMTFEK